MRYEASCYFIMWHTEPAKDHNSNCKLKNVAITDDKEGIYMQQIIDEVRCHLHYEVKTLVWDKGGLGGGHW